MKFIKNIIGFVIAIAVVPAIILTVKDVTELKGVKDVHFELLSEEENEFIITTGTYNKLIENKNIINYDIESNYPLITREEMDRATWKINDDLKNEIYIDENGRKQIIERVGKITFNGSENWRTYTEQQNEFTEYYFLFLSKDINIKYVKPGNEILNAYAPGFEASSSNRVWSKETTDEVFTVDELNDTQVLFRIRIAKERLNGRTIKEYFSENPLTIYYELLDKTTRPVEVYDFSDFKLTYDNNRISVLFDIDEGYYLWEITNDDRLIPINGQYDLGNVWTVKFYVYKIQQPLLRSLILLIPLIMISGLLFYLFKLLKIKD